MIKEDTDDNDEKDMHLLEKPKKDNFKKKSCI